MCPWPSGKGAGLPNQTGGFDSHRALSGIGYRSLVGQVVELEDTRRLERRAVTGVGVRLSPWSLRSGLESGFQHGLISRLTPVRIRPPQLDGRVRKSAKRPGREPGDGLWVRFPPRLLRRSRGPAAKTPGPHPGDDGSSPSGIILGCWSNRTTPAPHAGNEGATPSRSTRWKVAGYGWPGRSAKAVLPTEMRVRLPCLPLATRPAELGW